MYFKVKKIKTNKKGEILLTVAANNIRPLEYFQIKYDYTLFELEKDIEKRIDFFNLFLRNDYRIEGNCSSVLTSYILKKLLEVKVARKENKKINIEDILKDFNLETAKTGYLKIGLYFIDDLRATKYGYNIGRCFSLNEAKIFNINRYYLLKLNDFDVDFIENKKG